jgi:hypothetical protein
MVSFGLPPRWSDGSGAGISSTNDVHSPQSTPDMCMGIKAPHVFLHTSNWLELQTLLLTLELKVASRSTKIRGTTVFDFIDSTATYHVVNNGP